MKHFGEQAAGEALYKERRTETTWPRETKRIEDLSPEKIHIVQNNLEDAVLGLKEVLKMLDEKLADVLFDNASISSENITNQIEYLNSVKDKLARIRIEKIAQIDTTK